MSKYEWTVSFTPLCTSCGGELQIGCTESRPDLRNDIFDRGNEYDLKDRRVFVFACSKCFAHRGDIPPTQPETQEGEK